MPDRVVVDASAVAAILFGESGSQDVLLAAGEAELWAPRLLPFELANVAWKKASRSPGQRKTIVEALGLFEELGIRLLDIEPVPVASLALDLEITAYDASYVWLSRRLDAPVITLDQRLKRALG